MEVRAEANYIRVAPRKIRLIAGLIRGMPAETALTELRYLPKRAARPMEKLLRSAIANARHNFSLEEKNLRVKQVLVNAGPVLKRTDPRAFGRAAIIRKRMSHIELTLDEVKANPRKSHRPKTGAPEVRKASLEDLRQIERESADSQGKSAASEKRAPARAKDRGFVRRIFNRKSI